MPFLPKFHRLSPTKPRRINDSARLEWIRNWLLSPALASLAVWPLAAASEEVSQPTIAKDGSYVPPTRPKWSPEPADAAKHQQVLSKLKAYLAGVPPNGRKLTVAYVTPADLEPLPDDSARIDRVMKDIQAYYREEMAFNGFGPLTFDLELDSNGKVVIHHAKGKKRLAEYVKAQAGEETRNDVLPILKEAGINPNDGHLMIFCQMPDGISPYYGGGSFRSGTCWACDLAHQDPMRLTDVATKLPNGRTVGADNTVYIGGTAHELGHCFGLPHTAERPGFKKSRGTSLMGAGNYTYREELRGSGKGSYLAESDAIRLASNPLFNRRDKDRDAKTTAALTDLSATWQDGWLTVSGRVDASPAAYAVIAYNDPAGGDDYDAPSFTAVPDASGRFTLKINGLRKTAYELRLAVCHLNGATTLRSWNYPVKPDGSPDLESLTLRWVFQPVFDAINSNPTAVPALLTKVTAAHPGNPMVAKWAATLANLANSPSVSPADVPAETKSVFLSDTRPNSAKTGYGPALSNRVYGEGGQVLIFNGGQAFAKGLYAHAPARHAYQLSGKWSRLTGQAGLQDGKDGSVVFVIRSGEKELFRSLTVKDGSKCASFDLDVRGLDAIELSVENGGDGNSSDWGVWLAPELSR